MRSKTPFSALIFFHPDYTVGFGITPNQLSLAGFAQTALTAGGELHPAPKTAYKIFKVSIHFLLSL